MFVFVIPRCLQTRAVSERAVCPSQHPSRPVSMWAGSPVSGPSFPTRRATTPHSSALTTATSSPCSSRKRRTAGCTESWRRPNSKFSTIFMFRGVLATFIHLTISDFKGWRFYTFLIVNKSYEKTKRTMEWSYSQVLSVHPRFDTVYFSVPQSSPFVQNPLKTHHWVTCFFITMNTHML